MVIGTGRLAQRRIEEIVHLISTARGLLRHHVGERMSPEGFPIRLISLTTRSSKQDRYGSQFFQKRVGVRTASRKL